MLKLKNLVATLCVTFIVCFAGNILAQPGELDSVEAHSLEFLLLLSETKSMEYQNGSERFDAPLFTDFAGHEQRHMETLENLAQQYIVEIDRGWWGCFVLFWGVDELDFMCDPFATDQTWRTEQDKFVRSSALLKELSIRKILQAIEETDEQILIDAYSEMLEVAYLHLLNFAAVLHHDPFGYVAQILDQSTVDSVLIEVIKMNAENFEINSGLNDAWHEPTTNGQGFFLMVYPESATVFLGWFTYDVEFPGQEARASLGDTCQRWLTAQGSFDGAQAELVVYNSSGGLFNSTLPVPGLEPIGSITLQFEDCENGSVSYDLPGIGVSGLIPIERVASDNVAACVVQAYPIN